MRDGALSGNDQGSVAHLFMRFPREGRMMGGLSVDVWRVYGGWGESAGAGRDVLVAMRCIFPPCCESAADEAAERGSSTRSPSVSEPESFPGPNLFVSLERTSPILSAISTLTSHGDSLDSSASTTASLLETLAAVGPEISSSRS